MKMEPVTFEDYQRWVPFFRDQPYRLCAYSLPSIIAWSNDIFHPIGAVVDDLAVFGAEFPKEPERRHLILPVSPERDLSPEDLADLARAGGFPAFWFVPECYIERWGEERVGALFSIEEQTAYEDYIYRSHDLSELKGNRYAKKRNLIHQFTYTYVDEGRAVVEDIREENVPECLEFLDEWCEMMDCEGDVDRELLCEKLAIINTLEHISTIDVSGLLVRVDGVVSAFGIGSMLTADMGVLNFEKAYPHIKGLYQFLDQKCARRIFNGAEYINKESDMNLPGLAKSKKSYGPVDRVKSFKLTLH